jgi:replicative DNA helicase
MDEFLRTPPHSVEAEQNLLAGLLREPYRMDDMELLSDDFYAHQNKLVYGAIKKLADMGKEIDVVTVCDELNRISKLDEVGGLEYVGALVASGVTGANVKRYAEIIKEKSLLRELIVIGSKMVEGGYDASSKANELVEISETEIFSIMDKRETSEPVDMAVAVAEAVEYLDKALDGVTYQSSGLTDLDAILGGLRGGALYVFAARPSMGKTALMCSIVNKVVEDKHCYIATLEMPRREIASRLISMVGNVNLNNHAGFTNECYDRITFATGKVNSMNITIDHEEGLSLAKLRARCRRIKRKKNLGAVFVDYLQLMRCKAESREREVAEISAGLKSLAKELDVPVIVLSQLNRDLEKRSDRRPMMSDLRESGAIEQDADVVVMLYRDEVYNKDTQYAGIAELLVRKNRHGATGDVVTQFNKETMHFRDKAADWMMPVQEQSSKYSRYNDL